MKDKKTEILMLYTTVDDLEIAKKIAKLLVEEKLAGCVNNIPNISSIYQWEGQIQESLEYIVLIKSIKDIELKLIDKLKDIHPYSSPCILQLSLKSHNSTFDEWINKLLG